VSLGQIRVSDVIDDVRGGMTDSNMMDKYKLSSNGLARLFRKLLDHKALSPFDFVQWSALFCERPEVKNIRVFPRDSLKLRLPIYEAGRSEMRGEVLNISDGGLAVRGLEAQVNDTRSFLIPIKGAAVLFKAKCRWTKQEPVHGATVRGFDVIDVLKGNWDKLLELIQAESLRREKVTRAEVSPTNSDTEAPKSEMAIGESVLPSHEPESKIEEPVVPASMSEEPTLSSVQQYLDSNNYHQIFTNRRYLTFVVNPLNFTELSPEKRQEMSDRVREIAKLMLTDLRRKAFAFRLAIENGSLLADS
jgi:hypothetical protein